MINLDSKVGFRIFKYRNLKTIKVMERLGVFLAAIGMIVVMAVLLAWPVQWLWNNALIGAVDGFHPIGFWQALGINILCGILFRNSTSSK